MQSYWHEFIALAVIHFLAVIAPGPDFAVAIRQSVRFGHLVGIYTALGIGAGISIHVVYTLIGVSALMHSTPWLMTTAKVIGSAYIIWLGIQFIRSKPKDAASQDIEDTAAQAPTWQKAFLTGFITNATNPKATLFFLAVFTTVVSRDTPISVQIAYGMWMCGVTALWFVFVSLFFSNPSVRMRFLQQGYWFERVMGVVLLGFALRLLLTTV